MNATLSHVILRNKKDVLRGEKEGPSENLKQLKRCLQKRPRMNRHGRKSKIKSCKTKVCSVNLKRKIPSKNDSL